MAYVYRPRGMPARFMEGAPDCVKQGVIDILFNGPDVICEYDVILRPEPDASEITGLDFDTQGALGCHFFLAPHEARTYRERNRRNRVAWRDLPLPARKRIESYLTEES